MLQGEVSVLEYTIDNSASALAATGLAFTNNLPAGVDTVGTAPVSNTCSGSPTVNAGVISLSGGSVAAGGSCTLSVQVRSILEDSYLNTTGNLTSSSGDSGTATAIFSVGPAPTPVFTAVFRPGTVVEGEQSVLEYTIDNSASALAATGLTFTNNLPAGVDPVGATALSNSCSGSPVVNAGVISLSGGAVAEGGTCTLSVQVLSVAQGVYVNTTGNLTSSAGTSAGASATLTVDLAPAPTLAKAFADPSIEQGDVTTLTFTIDNTAAAVPVTDIAFSDPLPAGVTVAAVPNITNSCIGGTNNFTPGTSVLNVDGTRVPTGATCTIAVDVRAVTPGDLVNTSSTLSSPKGTSPAATAPLTVTPAPLPAVDLLVSPGSVLQGQTLALSASVTNPALVDIDSVQLRIPFIDGALTLATVADGNDASTSCAGATPVGGAGASTVGFDGGAIPAGGTCTFSVTMQAADAATATIQSQFRSSVGNGPGGTAPLSVQPAPLATLTAGFAPATVIEGATSVLTFEIDNGASFLPVTGVGFQQTLPAGLSVADGASLSASGCTLTGTRSNAAGQLIQVQNVEVAELTTCSVSVSVQALTDGAFPITSTPLQTNLGPSNAASASLDATPAPLPVLAKSFAPASIVQGGVSVLEITIDNAAALVPATDAAFDDVFPTGLVIAGSAAPSFSCAGTLAALPGGAGLTLADGVIPAGGNCTATVAVTAAATGDYVNEIPGMTSSLGTSLPAQATLGVTPAPTPTASKSFAPASIVQGGVSRLTIEVDNGAALVDALDVSISDPLPAGLVVADPSNPVATCDGIGTGSPGETLVAFFGGEIPAGATCSLSINVTAAETGSYRNVTDPITTSLGTIAAAEATLDVTPAPAPTFAAVFADAAIVQGDATELTLTIGNAAALVPAEDLAFDLPFAANMRLDSRGVISSDCGGSPSFDPGTATFAFTGTTLGAGETCQIVLGVTDDLPGTRTQTAGPLTSSLGDSGTASASLTVDPAPAPDLALVFAPDSIAQGGVATATYTIAHTDPLALVPALDLAFSHDLLDGMTVAAPPNASTTCGGTVAADAGGSTLSLGGGTVAPAATCTVTVDLVDVTVGSRVHTTGDLQSSLGTSAAASATLSVTAAGLPVFAKVFSPDSIVQGDVSTLTLTIDNGTALVAAENAAFEDVFPEGLTLADAPALASTCGDVTLAGDGTGLTLSGGTVPASGTCEISVDVTALEPGEYVNTSGDLTTSLGNSGTAAAILAVTSAGAPGFAKVFAPDSIVQGGVTTLTFTVDNASALVAATDLAFADTFPEGMTVAATPNVATTCAEANVEAAAGAGALTFAAPSLAAGEICALSVDVTAALAGEAENVSGALTSSLGDSGTASAVLSVTAADAPAFAKVFAPDSIVQGGVTTLTFTIDNGAALVAATDLAFDDTFPEGMTVAATPNMTTTCADATIEAAAGAGALTFAAPSLAAGEICALSVDVTAALAGEAENVSGALTSSLGDSGTASAVLSVTAPVPPASPRSLRPTASFRAG
ncbi:hypothetical protein [Aestuariicoccus sp. MJ-SS9]|uniref:beta strand repeat-containing protein n=1 Tax=Aestuariicoccus sp. MJ-SS9 TaxID=3079855 RepID=UPI002910E549|nr:hypothetical protein [Aestuariicoccus sp. MJ-SS9]MDU8910050.1 hypothetical protein [Aestuariicoccus sp. MJ-SS9]